MELTTYTSAKVNDIENLDGVALPSPFKHKEPQDLRWVNIDFKVGEKNILKDCWGHVPAGKTCAIMGASGILFYRYFFREF